MSRFEHDSHAGRNRTAFNSSTDARAWEDSPRRYSQRYSRDFRSHGGRGSIPKACTRQSVFEHIPWATKRSPRSRTTWLIFSACSAKVCSGRSKRSCAKL